MASVRFTEFAVRITTAVVRTFVLTAIFVSTCAAADLVFIRSISGSAAELERLRVATEFYGLNLRVVTVDSLQHDLSFRGFVRNRRTLGVAIGADALGAVNQRSLLRALRREFGNPVPLFILGVVSNSNPLLLKSWSSGSIEGSNRSGSMASSVYLFSQSGEVTSRLSGLEAPFRAKDAFYLVLSEHSAARAIASAKLGSRIEPVFVEMKQGDQRVFIASPVSLPDDLPNGDDVVTAFLRAAPEMLFVHFCAGDQGWHFLHHYANLTIDDPWLREPYGAMNYHDLLVEMNKHDFHTTIAFIPWNYDRSKSDVVSIFRSHPERFSIAIHGDDHDHKEFTDYARKPLTAQVRAVKQSIARMEKFQSLTGIPYDRVMVFPHSIAPAKTLQALKTYNYLGTVNATNVPEDLARPSSSLFALRPVSLSFSGFPSASRLSVTEPVTKEFIAVNDFLENPMFFYAHSDLFSNGIQAFNRVADSVKENEPDTRWRSLGEIFSNLYAVRRTDDSNYDAMAFSSSVCLENPTQQDATFHLQKEETSSEAVAAVRVDNQSRKYRKLRNHLELDVAVQKHGKSCVAIEYANDFASQAVDTSRSSPIAYFLRLSSDCRDLYLSRFSIGLSAIRLYNLHQVKPFQIVLSLLAILAIAIYCGHRFLLFFRNRSLRLKRPTLSSNIHCRRA